MKSLALGVLLFATTAAIDVSTLTLADGATQTFSVGSRLVGVHKEGTTATVRVQEGDRVDTVTLTRDGSKLTVGHTGNNAKHRLFVVDRPKVVVDGIDLEPWLSEMAESGASVAAPAPKSTTERRAVAYFVCPKDHAMLRVPSAPADATYKCPVDGTTMKRGTGPSEQYYLLQ